MPFYDDGRFRSTRRRAAAPRSLLAWTCIAVISALVGSGVTLLALPAMIQTGAVSFPVVQTPKLSKTNDRINRPVNVSINDAIVQAVKRVTPSVVGIVTFQVVQSDGLGGNADQEQGVGSGVVFDPRGYIVTNNHVVQGAAKVEVITNDKRHVYASVVGTDAYTDLAVLKIPPSYVSAQDVATFGDSGTLQAGEPAIAIGNPAGLDFTDSVTFGVISATQRTMPVQDEATGQVIGQETVLQTDAAINPGNSGGPLLNIAGQVIGINSSKIVAKGFEGMGFAIPIDEVRTIVGQIMATGHAEHPALGIEGESLSAVPQDQQPDVPIKAGVWVFQATSVSAKEAGLERGDVIAAINHTRITGLSDLRAVLWQGYRPGQWVAVTFYRGRDAHKVRIQLGDLPPFQSSAGSTGSSGGDNWFGGP